MAMDEAPPQLGATFRMAVVAGVVEAVRLHVARGDRLDARDASGMTPFMLACRRNKVRVCQLLLDAGADPWLLTPSGASALDIAEAAGAAEVVSLLQQLQALRISRERVEHDEPAIDDFGDIDALDAHEADSMESDGWEAESESVSPSVDPCVREEMEVAQAAISHYVPQDDSADWDDVEVLLPDQALLQSNSEDPESLGRLRGIFLRAIREGSVPEQLVEELARSSAGNPDQDVFRALQTAIQDLGAECDERFEYSTPWEDFHVHIDANLHQDEEAAVADAISFVESLVSPKNDPLRLYQREFVHHSLLTQEEEVALGKAMEQGIALACDALARWVEGLRHIADAIAMVCACKRPARWLRVGSAEAPNVPQLDDGDRNSAACVTNESLVPVDEVAADKDPDAVEELRTHASEELEELAVLVSELETIGSSFSHDAAAARRIVLSLNLARGFLVELMDVAASCKSEPAKQFHEAMGTYLQARDTMVCSNLKLAFHHARKALFSGLDLADLTQEANLGLIRAVDKFDWRRGYRFSTYATWWVRQQIFRAIGDDSRLIRLPVHLHEKLQQARRVSRELEKEFGNPPTNTEIAERIGVSAASVEKWFKIDQVPESLDEVALVECMSIDAHDRFVVRDPFEIVGRIEEARYIDSVLSSLGRKEAQVIQMRFGLGNLDPMTLEEVGVCFNFTRERARQIEASGLRKLKHPARSELLLSASGRMSAATARSSCEQPKDERPVEHVGAIVADHAVSLDKEDSRSDSGLLRSCEITSATTRSNCEQSKDEPSVEHVRAIAVDQAASPHEEGDPVQQVLELAEREGLVVEDGRKHEGDVWVYLVTPSRPGEWKVLSELIHLGFKLLPGKGYWR